MATINQLVRVKRKQKKGKSMIKALAGCCFKKGVCVKVFTTKPKKPNSAIRKVARVKLSNDRMVTAAIPGIGHKLQEYSHVLVRAGRANDLPGVRFKLVKGKYDFDSSEDILRGSKRSKFGVKKVR